jgi:F0F1-type ATP synthase membrane subunit b/b'
MSIETVNILSLILGAIAVISPFILSYFTNKLIQAEDKRAKEMIEKAEKRHEEIMREIQKSIDEGNKRGEKILMEIQKSIEAGNERVEKLIDEGNKRLEIILSEILKRV